MTIERCDAICKNCSKPITRFVVGTKVYEWFYFETYKDPRGFVREKMHFSCGTQKHDPIDYVLWQMLLLEQQSLCDVTENLLRYFDG